MEGRLIGSASTFLEEIKSKYGKIMSLPQDTLKRRSALNVKIISEEMRKVNTLLFSEIARTFFTREDRKSNDCC